MKRVITLLLAGALSLSLCACGAGVPEKYQDVIDNLENGNYQGAIDLIETIEQQDLATSPTAQALTPEQTTWKTDAVGTWSPDQEASQEGHTGIVIKDDGTCTVDGKAYAWKVGEAGKTNVRIEMRDGAKKICYLQIAVSVDYGYKRATLFTYMDEQSAQSAKGSYYRDEDYTVVEITNDNWQEYFELKEVLSTKKNAFDEIDQFCGTTYFRLKDSYGTVNSELSTCAMEHKSVSTCQDITVNLIDMSYVPVGRVRNTAENNETEELSAAEDAEGARYYGCSVGGFVAYDVNKNATDTVWRPMDIEILRVQGTLYIVK